MSKHSRAIEVYEDNAGGLHVFVRSDDPKGIEVVTTWGAYLNDPEAMRGVYIDLLEAADPVADGWECGGLDGLDMVRRDYEDCTDSDSTHLIASSDYVDDDNPAGLMLESLGIAGMRFAETFGINLDDIEG